MEYALVNPQNAVDRVASNIDPTAPTKAGYRWLPVEDGTKPARTSPLQSFSRAMLVEQSRVVRGWAIETRAPTSGDVDGERDRRMAVFAFGGKSYDSDDRAIVSITGALAAANAAILLGSAAGDLRWSDADVDFAWIAKDNSRVAMDAQTCFAFAQSAINWRGDHMHAARAIKDMSPIPTDYAADARWPS